MEETDVGLILGLGRSSGEGNGYYLQCSCLRIPWAKEPGGLQFMAVKSQTRLNDECVRRADTGMTALKEKQFYSENAQKQKAQHGTQGHGRTGLLSGGRAGDGQEPFQWFLQEKQATAG